MFFVCQLELISVINLSVTQGTPDTGSSDMIKLILFTLNNLFNLSNTQRLLSIPESCLLFFKIVSHIYS